MQKLTVAKDVGGTLEGFEPIGKTSDIEGNIFGAIEAMKRFDLIISIIIGFFTVIAGLWFIFQFFFGAFGWITAGGDKAKVEQAQKKITSAVIGLVIVIAAIFVIDLIGSVLGLKILSPGDFFINIWNWNQPQP